MSYLTAWRTGAVALVVLVAACGNESVNPGGDGHIKTTLRTSPEALPAGQAGIRVTGTAGTDSIVLERMFISYSNLAAMRANGSELTVLSGSRTTEIEFINMPPNNIDKWELTVLSPVATVSGFRGRVSTVRVQGVHNGTPFDQTYEVNSDFSSTWAKTERVERGDTLYVTINVDPRLWFVASGTVVNPTSQNTAVRAAIAARIAASIVAVEDEDEDGLDED